MFSKAYHWILIIIYLTTISCARQSAPTGGPKDTIPPVLIKSLPAQNQTNFNDRTIELSFSEMIALANPKEQIIIAPATENTYEITNRNNRVIIKFDNPLQDSSTYSINFRDAVQDVTEKNPAENLQLAFSTGSYVDSLTISGTVYNLLTGISPKEATIAIFPENDTLSIFKHKASYLTKSDKKGTFILRNLKPGRYSIFAIEDKNRNLLADSRSESYAFLQESIELKQNTSGVSLPLIRLDARPLRITNSRPYNTYYNIKTSKNLAQYTLTSTDTVLSTYGEDRANIKVYNTFHADSTLVHLLASDSIGNKIDSSFFVKFIQREVTPEKFSMSVDEANVFVHRGTFNALLNFNKPVIFNNKDSLYFQIDSLNTIPLSNAELTWNSETSDLKISQKFDPKPYNQATANDKSRKDRTKGPSDEKTTPKPTFVNKLIIGRATFISVDNDTSVSLSRDIKPLQLSDLGSLTLQIETEQPNYIAQLLTAEYKVLRSTPNTKKVRWDDLPPGNYRVRLIIDKNNNGIWDAGNYLIKQEPEPLIYLVRPDAKPENTVFIRANWDVDDILIKY